MEIFVKYYVHGSRTTAVSEMELFAVIGNGYKPLTIIRNSSMSDIAVALDTSLQCSYFIYLVSTSFFSK